MNVWLTERKWALHYSLQFGKGINNFMKLGFQPNIPFNMHSSENTSPPPCLALHGTSYKYRPIHVFPIHGINKETAKICKTLLPEKSHMHILFSRHKTFLPLTRRWPLGKYGFPILEAAKAITQGMFRIKLENGRLGDALPYSQTHAQILLCVHLNELLHCKGIGEWMSSVLALTLKALSWLSVGKERKKRGAYSNNCYIIASGSWCNFAILFNKFWQYDTHCPQGCRV